METEIRSEVWPPELKTKLKSYNLARVFDQLKRCFFFRNLKLKPSETELYFETRKFLFIYLGISDIFDW